MISSDTVYASGRDGWASLTYPDGPRENMIDLLDTIVKTVPKPKVHPRRIPSCRIPASISMMSTAFLKRSQHASLRLCVDSDSVRASRCSSARSSPWS
eukprot:1133922-Rhodomonas_salina.2